MRRSLFLAAAAALALAGCRDPGSGRAGEAAGPAGQPVEAGGAAAAEATLLRIVGPARYDECLAERPLQMIEGEALPAESPSAVRRLVVAVDSSGSMAGRFGDRSKMAAAQEAAGQFLGQVPPSTEVALVAFGHRGSNRAADKAQSCAAVEPLLPLGAGSTGDVAAAIRRLEPVGWTPLAAALEASARLLPAGAAGEQIVYVVSDGVETCGGDPVAAARTLHAGPQRAIVNIIGFDLPEADQRALRDVAEAGGGTLINLTAAEADRLRATVQRAMRDARLSARGALVDARNLAGTALTNARSRTCLVNMMNRERLALVRAGRTGPDLMPAEPALADADVRREVGRLLDLRHEAALALVERQVARTAAAADARSAEIDAVVDAARAEPPVSR